MKILFTHHRYHTNLFNWFRGFQQNGHEVRLLVYKPDEVNEPDLPKSTYLPPSKWSVRKMQKNPRKRGDGVDSFSPYYYPSFSTLYQYFKNEKPDLVVIRPVFSRFGYMVLICSFLFRTKRVFYSQIRIHKSYPKHKLYIFNFMMWVLKAHWISPCLGDKVSFPKAPVRMIYFPFSMPLLTQTAKDEKYDDEIQFLSVVKYFKSKNPKLVLEVFLDLCKDYDKIRLTICGSGDENGVYYKEMKEVVEASEFNDRVRLLINKSYDKVQDLYRSSDVFILPSRHDPAAITNLEAMAHGLPVICSRNNGTSGYTVDGESGYIIDVNQNHDLRNGMRKFIEDKRLLSMFSKRTISLVQNNHNPKTVAQNFIQNKI